MGDYEKTITVDMAPARLFSYLADVRNLPAYLPRLTSATPVGGDKVDVSARIDPDGGPERDVEGQAWVHVIEEGASLEWGAPGPHDYHGELHIGPGDTAETATLTVRLHTEQAEGDQIDKALAETLTGIKHATEQA